MEVDRTSIESPNHYCKKCKKNCPWVKWQKNKEQSTHTFLLSGFIRHEDEGKKGNSSLQRRRKSRGRNKEETKKMKEASQSKQGRKKTRKRMIKEYLLWLRYDDLAICWMWMLLVSLTVIALVCVGCCCCCWCW